MPGRGRGLVLTMAEWGIGRMQCEYNSGTVLSLVGPTAPDKGIRTGIDKGLGQVSCARGPATRDRHLARRGAVQHGAEAGGPVLVHLEREERREKREREVTIMSARGGGGAGCCQTPPSRDQKIKIGFSLWPKSQ